jgi:hypothetical protein
MGKPWARYTPFGEQSLRRTCTMATKKKAAKKAAKKKKK